MLMDFAPLEIRSSLKGRVETNFVEKQALRSVENSDKHRMRI